MSTETINTELQIRTVKYALMHLRKQIHETQQKLIRMKATQAEFPDTGLSEFSAAYGSFKTAGDEADWLADDIESTRQRVARYQADYDALVAPYLDYQERRTKESFKQFWSSREGRK